MTTPSSIVERMAEVYATCSSYRDDGECVTVFVEGPRPFQRRTTRRPFKTLFVRPDRWRFEQSDAGVGPESEWPRMVVWTDEHGCHRWSTREYGLVESNPIGLLLSGASEAHTVSRLLNPTLGGRNPSRFTEIRVDGVEEIDGRLCHRLVGKRPRCDAEWLWIDVDSFLLRKLSHVTVFDEQRERMVAAELAQLNEQMIAEGRPERFGPCKGGGRRFEVEHASVFRPLINVLIDPAEFEFAPPV